jgi:recombination protein RecT
MPDNTDDKPGTDLVAGFDHAKKLLEQYSKPLVKVMPRGANPDTFLGLAIAAIRKDPYLIQAAQVNPQSLILALRQCAYLGHVPTRGLYALIPFRNRNAPGGWEVVGVEEYRGIVERMFRAGGVRAVKYNVGRTNDPVLRFNPTTMDLPEHVYDEFAAPEKRGPLKVAYAWAVMASGTPSAVAWLPLHEIVRARSFSKSGDKFWGPEWPAEGPNTERMWLKTALHRLEPLVPTSSEYRDQLQLSHVAAVGDEFAGMPDPGRPIDGVWDAEVIEP